MSRAQKAAPSHFRVRLDPFLHLAPFPPVENVWSETYINLLVTALWVDVDLNVGLIIACLPSLRPYLRMMQSGSRSETPELELNKHAVRKSRPSVKDRFPRSEGGFEATNKSLTPLDLEAQAEWYHEYMSRTETSNGANSGRSLGSDVELVDAGRQTN